MKTFSYLLITSLMFFTSCKDEQKVITPTPYQLDFYLKYKEEAALLVEKQEPIIVEKPTFIPFKRLKVLTGTDSGSRIFDFSYDENNNLLEFKEFPETYKVTFTRDNDLLVRRILNAGYPGMDIYDLNNEGFSTYARHGVNPSVRDGGSEYNYLYKNGHRIATVGFVNAHGGILGIIAENKYSSTGNLINRTFADGGSAKNVFTYEYTAFPNTINQDVLSYYVEWFLTRTVNLGRFSTNLIKKITIEEGFMKGKTIEFEYVFDDQNRVSKINIVRDGMPITMEYQY